jgi:hypothetical protein
VRGSRVIEAGAGALVDRGDVDGGFVAHSELAVPRGHSAVACEPADAALDGVALLVALRVEDGAGGVPGIPFRTAWGCGLSPRWPAVITTGSGFGSCSHGRRILVDSPSRDRPSA